MRSIAASLFAALLVSSAATTAAKAELPTLESIQLLNSMLVTKPQGTDAKIGKQNFIVLTGRYVITINAILLSGQTQSLPINCYGSIQLDDAEVAWSEIGRSVGTITGNIATCRVSIPFSWGYVPAAARLRVVYGIGSPLPDSRSRESLSARFFPLPVNGATTYRVFNTRL